MSQLSDDEEPEPPHLRRLRLLVNLLMLVMILGMVIIAGTILIRIGLGGGAQTVSAETIALPDGHDVLALGEGDGTLLFLLAGPTGQRTLYRFDASDGTLIGTVDVVPE